MYSIYIKAPREDSNSLCIYDDLILDEEYQLIDPVLVREDNASGSLSFEVPLKNIGYSEIKILDKNMDVFVYRQGYSNEYGLDGTDDVYWGGRVASIERAIDNHKQVYCEGALAFLNDTIQTPGVYETNIKDNDASFSDPTKKSLHNYIEYLLGRHNAMVAQNRKIYLGETTAVYEPTKWYTNFESTMSVLDDIASAVDGHFRIRRSFREDYSAWVLDLLNDDTWVPGERDSNDILMTDENKWRYRWIPNATQQIEFGENLTDIDIAESLSSVVTAVYPTGERKENSSIEGLDEYYTINGCDTSKIPTKLANIVSVQTDPQGYKYVKSSLANDVGLLAISVQYDDVKDPTELMLLGILELTLPDTFSCELEASAIDGYYRDHSLKQIDTFDVIQVVDEFHDVISALKVSKAEIPLDNPADTTFTMGSNYIYTFTALANKRNKNLNSGLKYLTIKPYQNPEPDPPAPDSQTESEE